jgi:hypothetical protein
MGKHHTDYGVYICQGATSRWLHIGEGRENPLELSSRCGVTRVGPSCDCELCMSFTCPWTSSLFCDFVTFVRTFSHAISDSKIDDAFWKSSVIKKIWTILSSNFGWGNYASKLRTRSDLVITPQTLIGFPGRVMSPTNTSSNTKRHSTKPAFIRLSSETRNRDMCAGVRLTQ